MNIAPLPEKSLLLLLLIITVFELLRFVNYETIDYIMIIICFCEHPFRNDNFDVSKSRNLNMYQSEPLSVVPQSISGKKITAVNVKC